MSRRMLMVVLAVSLLALPAAAKGLESATLEGPGSSAPIVFLDQGQSTAGSESHSPIDLMGMTGIYGHGLTAIDRPTELGPEYIVTWVSMGANFDIVQYLYPEATGGPAILTPKQRALSGWGRDIVGWFAASDSLDEAIDEVVAWARTPAGRALQPNPLPAASPDGAAPIGEALVLAAAIGIMLLARIGHSRRAGVNELS